MIVGLAQTYIEWENKNANLDKIKLCLEKFVTVCKEKNVLSTDNIIFFPEMSLTGFSMNTDATAESDKETVHEIEHLSKEYGISVGIGWVKRKKIRCENHYSIITPQMGEILDYAKMHPFSYGGEDEFFLGGDSLDICCFDKFKIGTAICYDLRFPEIFQILSENADFIVIPANWPKARREHWITLLRARAIENQCFIAGINCCGNINNIEYSGDSCMFGPDGAMLSTMDIIELYKSGNDESKSGADFNIINEQILIYDINNSVDIVRESFPVKRDRRKDLYRKLYE